MQRILSRYTSGSHSLCETTHTQETDVKLTLEIRPAEGGDDAKLLVHDQAAIYQNYATRKGLKAIVEARGYL